VYLLFLAGLVAVVAGVAYPAEALLAAASPGSLVTAEAGLTAAPFVLGGTAVLLGSCSLVVAELLFLARR
jgi:hypothetical protein